MVQATGPSGVQPKKWLTPGVWITPARTTVEAAPVSSTSGLRQSVASVWPSCVPTSAASPMVLARTARPLIRPSCQAVTAPSAVAVPRTASTRPSSRASESVAWPLPAASSSRAARPGAMARARAGSMSVSRLTRSSWRVPSGARPDRAVPRTVKATSPALPPTRMPTASRTRRHRARPSSSAWTMFSGEGSVRTRSAAALAEREPGAERPIPMSASLMAAASLTPSPVIATTRPARWRSLTIRTLCSGETRAKTAESSTLAIRSDSGSASSSAPVTTASAPGMPSRAAMAPAVVGWSPVIMVTRTPASWRCARVSEAPGRGVSLIARKPRSVSPVTCSGSSSAVNEASSSGRSATASTRRPWAPSRSTRRLAFRRRAASSGRGPVLPEADGVTASHRSRIFSGAPLTARIPPSGVFPAEAE